MITLVLVFSILILFTLSVYLFSKAEEEAQRNRQQLANSTLQHKTVVISTIQQGKVQETWCYIDDLRSRLKQANVVMKDSPATLENIFKG
ncbi:MAG: hypothetical protein ACFB15_14070 [Cyclobacteriaceae bacterium]